LQDGGVVILAGATKGTAAHRALVHGAYDLMPELYNGRALFRKRDNKTVWLRFTTAKNWIVSPAADKEANSDAGHAFVPGGDSALPPLSGWKMQDDGHFVVDEGISVTLSDALKVAVSAAVLILVTGTSSCLLHVCATMLQHRTLLYRTFIWVCRMCADLSSKRLCCEHVDTRLRFHFLTFHTCLPTFLAGRWCCHSSGCYQG
jgi:hypothetical protein